MQAFQTPFLNFPGMTGAQQSTQIVQKVKTYCIEIHKFPCYDVIRKLIYKPSVSFAGLIESKLGNDEANPYCSGFAFCISGDKNNNKLLFFL